MLDDIKLKHRLTMHVDFKDIKNVEIKEFSVSGTYDGCLEGNRQSVTKHILEMNRSKTGLLFLRPELTDGALKQYVYRLYASTDWEHRLELVWYDDGIPTGIPFLDYIQQITQNIEFQPNCLFVDIENI